MKKLTVILMAVLLLLTACGTDSKNEKTEITLFHATDVHYLSQQLTDNSEYFVEMIKDGDGKMTQYCEQISEAFVETVIEQKPDAVLISGDITFNGEKLSHEDFIPKLQRIEQAGIDVLVLPGNHDMEYPFTRGYEGNASYKADYTTEADFKEYYKDFGPDIAYTVSPDGFSYIVKLGKGIYAAMIHTPQSFMSGATIIEDETLQWLDSELAKLKDADKIVAVTHQNILNHYPDDDFSFKYTIQGVDPLTEIYEKYGVDVNLSGHIHLQHIAETDSGIADIATASLTVRNCQYGVVDITPESMVYEIQETDVAEWAKNNGVTDENLLNFEQYKEQFYFDSAYPKAMSGLEESGFTDSEKDALAALWAQFNVNYFAGTVDSYYPQMVESEGYRLWQQYGLEDNWSFNYIKTALSNGIAERSQLYWQKSFAE